MSEMIFIAVIALIVVGPSRLPEVARTVGKLLAEVKRASASFQDDVHTEMEKLGGEIKESGKGLNSGSLGAPETLLPVSMMSMLSGVDDSQERLIMRAARKAVDCEKALMASNSAASDRARRASIISSDPALREGDKEVTGSVRHIQANEEFDLTQAPNGGSGSAKCR
ncbi:MAG TPA: twin-arginine translocase TatA/TatE family subunit, partial [Candidatus Saccharimonadales bacterium]|nr:twin-arginine translocase TatA/TatE family subunit [Candidatus Saccharimonadales bacterium]